MSFYCPVLASAFEEISKYRDCVLQLGLGTKLSTFKGTDELCWYYKYHLTLIQSVPNFCISAHLYSNVIERERDIVRLPKTR